jgi:hypothetical protein
LNLFFISSRSSNRLLECVNIFDKDECNFSFFEDSHRKDIRYVKSGELTGQRVVYLDEPVAPRTDHLGIIALGKHRSLNFVPSLASEVYDTAN